ncbi:MAG: dTDP-4-dehydrorhamnose reductase [Eubacteriales bacterium]|nr:dTDP-4-dehydrorhamnose reductase [Eubacteriales bacterium]
MRNKILVTGTNGQLGFDICNELKKRNIEYISTDIKDMDITNKNSVESFIKTHSPDAIIHCAAYTQVDKAEEDIENCYKVNVDGTKNLASVCKNLDIPMMYFSTDYVFDGKGVEAFKVFDKASPQSVYGKTKYQGEEVIRELLKKFFIIRTSWVFGVNGHNFVETMIKLSQNHNEIKVVNDQIGSPTYTFDLAKLSVDMILTEKYGIFHATNEGFCSWADFAKEIFKIKKINTKVIPVSTEEYGLSKAKRPKNSRLDKSTLTINGFELLPAWEDALKRYIKEKEERNKNN